MNYGWRCRPVLELLLIFDLFSTEELKMVNQKYVKAHLATPKQRQALQPIADLLKNGDEIEIKLISGDVAVPLQGCIFKVFNELVQGLVSGSAVSVSCSDGRMTMPDAIELLGVTKKELLELVEWRIIPCEIVGNHRRFLVADLLNYLRTCRKKD